MTIYIATTNYHGGNETPNWEYMPYDLKGSIKAMGLFWFLTYWDRWYFDEQKCKKFCINKDNMELVKRKIEKEAIKFPKEGFADALFNVINEKYVTIDENGKKWTNMGYTYFQNGANYAKTITWDAIKDWMRSEDYVSGLISTKSNIDTILRFMLEGFKYNMYVKEDMKFDGQDYGMRNGFRSGGEWFIENYIKPLSKMKPKDITLDFLNKIEDGEKA